MILDSPGGARHVVPVQALVIASQVNAMKGVQE